MDAREYEVCIRSADEAMVNLFSHLHREKTPGRAEILRHLGFLRFMDAEKLDTLFVKHNGLCHDAFVR